MDDRAEFTAFYKESRDACLRAVIAVAADRSQAEDLVAEAFTRAWVGWRKVSHHPAPQAWVVRTALNTRVSWWRRRRAEGLSADPQPDIAANTSSESPFDDALLASLRRLSLRQREVIALRVLLDLDTETTALALGIAPGTVTAHLSRAIAAVRQSHPNTQPSAEVTQ